MFEESKNASILTIISNTNNCWDKSGLSLNPNITGALINQMRYSPTVGEWNWTHISQHIKITEVFQYPFLTWDRNGLSMNPQYNDNLKQLNMPLASGYWTV